MADILICGANEGIGYHMALALLDLGHRVAVLDVSLDSIGPLQRKFEGRLLCYEGDVRSESSVAQAVRAAAGAFGGLDAAVQNACLCPFSPFEDTDGDVLKAAFYVNYFGAVNLTRAAAPHMRAGGRILFTSSGVGVTGFPNLTAYASTKGAIESLAKCLRLEYARQGLSFHILHPPLTRTRSSAPLPVPAEFMASPEAVGRGLAKHLFSRHFIICHSPWQRAQTLMCYLAPLKFGSLMARMTARAN